jgi:ankyrin repeat protein
LLQATPATTEDYTYRLVGLAWTGASAAQRAAAVSELRALQRTDGGWGQLPRRESDAYATGEALVALAEAGNVPPTDAGWRKGLRYLLSTQNPDGSWRVATRMVTPAQVSPPYFETGFPFGHDQFISSAGTSYAGMALMLALPKTPTPEPAPGLPEMEPKGVQPWMRTALFGTAKEFQTLLDHGLDLTSHTEGGTTLLMMAAPDPVKMKMLLDRGVDVNAKAKSGYTALMVASLYRGAFDGIQLLLDRGANAAPGTGVMFNASPLLLAVFAGEPATLQLLHAKGADANRRMLLLGAFPASPLAQAVAMGEPEVIRTLVAAGADIKEHDPDGTSLLQMAAMTNHVEAAQALIAAGAPLNDADKHGYTPLLYASTVDFGDDRMVNLLLKAGADPTLRTKAGETPLSQAKRYHYAHIEAALEKAGARE